MSPENKSAPSLASVFTKDGHNKGAVLDVTSPTTGEVIAQITICGIDSDRYAAAMREHGKAVLSAREEHGSGAEYMAAIEAASTRLVAACVMSWTFAEECNEENVSALFNGAPYIRRLVDASAGKHKLFVKKA